MKGIILKDDTRYDYTETYLISQGHEFYDPEGPPEDLDFAIFSFKEDIDQSKYNDDYFAVLKSEMIIFSGVRSAYLTEKCKKYQLAYYVMMEDHGVSLRNAVPTSEGIIAYLIANRPETIAGSRILIIGYGNCGQDLARRLRVLDADVYALVRNREKECAAAAAAITPVYLANLAPSAFDVIINTVPKQILTKQMLEQTNETLLIDIASKPHGFPIEAAKERNEKSTLLPGIPGKHAIRTAGEILGGYIVFILNGRI